MKIIDQSHEILHITLDPLWQIELAGRTCYKSEKKIGCTDLSNNDQELCPIVSWDTYGEFCTNSHCDLHSSHKFVKMLKDRGHEAMIEFGDITVRFVTNRGVTHELVRHRLFSFAQESTRYVNYKGQMEFIKPVWVPDNRIEDMTAYHVWYFACQTAEERYRQLLKEGWRPEQAREVLPNSLKTEIVVKGNIREWRHCLTLRTSKKAHPQIRDLMKPLLKELQETIPIVFDDIGD
jgi:thymidylate synthase (FAD)